jgi:isoamylase
MLLAGDELGRSQQGNNNAYCQDNPITWQDWSALEHQSDLLDFVRELIRLRKRYPLLHRDRFVHGEDQYKPSGFTDIQWLRADGTLMQDSDWHLPEQRFLAMLLAAETMPARNLRFNGDQEAALVIAYNAGSEAVELTLPQSDYQWSCVFTTADEMPGVNPPTAVSIEPHSVQLFELQI